MADVAIECAVGKLRRWGVSGETTLTLAPGSYGLDFLATRRLSARFYGKQRFLPAVPVALVRGRVATNRTFDLATGAETTASPNAFSHHLFEGGTMTLSPADRWTLELPIEENPWFRTVSPSDVAGFDGSELSDAVLSLEFSAALG